MADAVVSLGLDPTAFDAGLNRAMQSAQGFGGRMSGLLSSPYAIAGLAAFGFAKAGMAARAELDRLHQSVSKLTSNTGGGLFRESGEIDSNISNLTKKFDELNEAAYPTTLGGLFKKELSQDPAEFRLPGMRGSTDRDIDADRQRVTEAISRELDAQVEKQKALTGLKREGIDGSEREAAIQKVMLSYKERIGDIDEKYSGVPGGGAARNKLQEEAAKQNILDLQVINRRADAAEREVQLQTKIGLLGQSVLTTDQQRLAADKLRLDALKTELNFAGTTERAAKIQSQIGPAETAVMRGKYAESKKPWSQRSEEMAAQQDYQNFSRRQTATGTGTYISHPDAYNRRDILGNQIDESGNVIGPGGTTNTGGAYRSQLPKLSRHMADPGHVMPYAGSGDFNDFFHKGAGGGATGEEKGSGDKWQDVISAINNPDWVK